MKQIEIVEVKKIDERAMYEKILLEMGKFPNVITWLKANRHSLDESMAVHNCKPDNAYSIAYLIGQKDAIKRILNLKKIAEGEIKKIDEASAKEGRKLQKLEESIK